MEDGQSFDMILNNEIIYLQIIYICTKIKEKDFLIIESARSVDEFINSRKNIINSYKLNLIHVSYKIVLFSQVCFLELLVSTLRIDLLGCC